MTSTVNKENTLQWLYGLSVHGIKLGLRNITELLRRLGDPQNSFRSVHVAGTDGKGSTCAMIDSVLRGSGIRTGLYTSPHLVDFNERIAVSGRHINDKELCALTDRIIPIVKGMEKEDMQCTFFEVTTAIAFLYFADMGVEYAVVEVGMGGRFDATNVIIPEVSVITNISLEHTMYLGDTIEKIAFEKAGIIKENVPVITMNRGSPLDVIREIASSKGSELIVVDDISVMSSEEDLVRMRYKSRDYVIGLPGDYQALNAAMAIEALGKISCSDKVKGHIGSGLKDVKWPGRMQKIDGMPIILDVSHTSAGSEVLVNNIQRIYGKVIVVFGVLNDKDIDSIARNLSKIASKMIITLPDTERATPLEYVNSIVSRYVDVAYQIDDVGKAIEKAMEIRGDEMILITGSLFMAGDSLKWLKKISAGS